MARYIDAEALEKWVYEFHPADAYWAVSMLRNAPTANVVEVVKCKNCIYKVDYNGRTMCSKFATKSGDHWYGLEAKDNEHFCSYGQRKTEDCANFTKIER